MIFRWSLLLVLVASLLPTSARAQVAAHAPTSVLSQSQAPAPPPAATGKAVAKVNGVVLTDRDLLREMYTIFPYARQHNGFPRSMEADIRKGALDMIIFEELVYQEAQREKLSVPAAGLQEALEKFRGKFADRQQYQEYLKAEARGSEQVLKDQLRRKLLIEAFLQAEVKKKSVVPPAEARDYYDKNQARFAHGDSFTFQSISIIPPSAAAEAVQEARKRIDEAHRQAQATKSYEEFGMLAEKVSEDDYRVNLGLHKAAEASTLPPEIVQVLKNMQPGQISDVMALGGGFTFMRFMEHVPPGVKSFDEVKDGLLKAMQQDREEGLRSALDKRLRGQSKIEMF